MNGTAATRAFSMAISSRNSSASGVSPRPSVISCCSASSASRRASRGPAAMARRRPMACFIERTTCRLDGLPELTKPARARFTSGTAASCFLTRSGRARSSKKNSMNSSFDSSKTNSSMPSPSGEALPPPWPEPPCGRSTRSPLTNSWLPGCTPVRRPPGPW